jgi:hypothetical protein
MDPEVTRLLLDELSKLSTRFDSLEVTFDSLGGRMKKLLTFPSVTAPSALQASATTAAPSLAAATSAFDYSVVVNFDTVHAATITNIDPVDRGAKEIITSTTPSRCSTVYRSGGPRTMVPVSTTTAATTTLSDIVAVVLGRNHAAEHHISVDVFTTNNSPTRCSTDGFSPDISKRGFDSPTRAHGDRLFPAPEASPPTRFTPSRSVPDQVWSISSGPDLIKK